MQSHGELSSGYFLKTRSLLLSVLIWETRKWNICYSIHTKRLFFNRSCNGTMARSWKRPFRNFHVNSLVKKLHLHSESNPTSVLSQLQRAGLKSERSRKTTPSPHSLLFIKSRLLLVESSHKLIPLEIIRDESSYLSVNVTNWLPVENRPCTGAAIVEKKNTPQNQ